MSHPYFRLLRLHQPTGIWLLLLPCWWAIALASDGVPSVWLMLLFGVGAVVMRGAGCVVNDMADREFDRKVERTKLRPLASGEITMRQAFFVLFMLLCVALAIAIQMKPIVLLLAASSLLLVGCYPFMKRITWWPQAFLGITFNWGALMGWAAAQGAVGWPAVLLYAGGVFWTLGYDTIYAHQDKADDVHAGVKSTALRLGEKTHLYVTLFYALAAMLWASAGVMVHGAAFILCMLPVAAHFMWQMKAVNLDAPASCMRIFRSNTTLGWLMFSGFVLSSVLHRSL